MTRHTSIAGRRNKHDVSIKYFLSWLNAALIPLLYSVGAPSPTRGGMPDWGKIALGGAGGLMLGSLLGGHHGGILGGGDHDEGWGGGDWGDGGGGD